MGTPTHYEVLGVPPHASPAEIRAAYRAAARTLHPDAGGSPAAMRTLNAAWHVLGDPARRAVYDRELAPAAGGTYDDHDGGVGTSGTGRPGDPPDRSDEWAEVYDDLLDGTPVGPTRPVEGWWALAPTGMLMVGVGFGAGAVVFASPAMLVFAAAALFIAFGLFVLAPLRAMTRPRR